jgi:DeoR/GlpR family transcriptional regulator of sugar metabolism
MRKSLQGNISLTTVIVMTAILLLSGLSVITSTFDLAKANQDTVYHELNVFRIRSCVEEALNRIKFNHAFTGVAAITFTDGSCSATVSNDPGGNLNIKLVALTSQTKNFYYSLNKSIDITNTPFIVTNQ